MEGDARERRQGTQRLGGDQRQPGGRHQRGAARAGGPVVPGTAGHRRLSKGRAGMSSNDVMNAPLEEVDPAIAEVLRGELGRQQQTLEMIASENFAPRAVLECQGSVL